MRSAFNVAPFVRLAVVLAAGSAWPVWGQIEPATSHPPHSPPLPPPAHVLPPGHIYVVPTTWRVPAPWRVVSISSVAASISIEDQVATTHLEIAVTNPGGTPQQAEMLLPVPDGVTIRSFQYDGTGSEPTATLLPKDQARQIYNSIVSSQRDPGLLEFAGLNLIRTSAFPIPAGGTQKIRITFEQLLTADAGRVDYVLPKSESLATTTQVPWTIKATIKSARPIATVYSPTHDLTTDRKSAGDITVTVPPNSAAGPGSFRLSYLVQQDKAEPSATLFAYPDTSLAGGKGGYFLLVASLPADRPADMKPTKREMTLVIDRSGSMRGEKMEQAKKAASNVLSGLAEGETFNIIDFSDSIQSFSKEPVAKDAASLAKALDYIRAIEANGGTNIHDAMLDALKPQAQAGSMPLVLFLTDGQATVGERSEGKIREDLKAANTQRRRIFSFGVGFDVNTPLLSGLSRQSRAMATFVQPQEDVEIKVSQVYRRLQGPQLASPALTALDRESKPTTMAVRDMLPAEMNDLFEGDQVVLVGQYTGSEPSLKFKLTGDWYGKPREFTFDFKLDGATTRQGFVPRLWATRKVASLVDTLRQQSADGNLPSNDDPKFKEVVEEIVRLSTRWGVMTEYTSFLALEPGQQMALLKNVPEFRLLEALSSADGAQSLAARALSAGNVGENRSGRLSVSQDKDVQSKAEANNVQSTNVYYTVDAKPRTPASPAGAAGPVGAKGGGGGVSPFDV
ncbi:MAG: VIT domain-containing protein, partial [Planctomycetota bacterium]